MADPNSTLDLRQLLQRYGIEHLAATFERNRVDLEVLADLSEPDLKQLDLPLGDRKRVMRLVAALRAQHGSATAVEHPGFAEAGAPMTVGPAPELRQMTVLFADLVDSTRLAERLDIEEMHEILARFHKVAAKSVREAGGSPARFLGDALLACFGFPRAAEDDALRAAKAGLRIVAEVRHLVAPGAAPLAARVGIATGIVLTGDLLSEGAQSFGPASGPVLNLAARLQSLAETNTVLADADTKRLVGGALVCTDLGRQSLKGIAEPVPVFRVDAAAGGLREYSAASGAIIGRAELLTQLRDRWDAAARGGQAVLVTGEPGIGKSRLVREFLGRIAPRPAHVLEMQCSATETLRPFHPVARCIEEMSGIDQIASSDARGEQLYAWVSGRLRAPSRTADVLAALLSIGDGAQLGPSEARAPDRKSAIFDALIDIVRRLGSDGPLIAVIEDLQWADPTTSEFLQELVETIATTPLLLVCTCREEHRPAFLGAPHLSVLHLPRLSREQSADLMQTILGEARLPPDLADEIVARTDGIPLFVEELTKSVLDSTAALTKLSADPQRGQLRGRPPLPTTLLGSLLARLDRIAHVQRVAPVGAAIGRTFRHDLLVRAAELTEPETEAILSDLISAGLLIKRGPPEATSYSFKHALVQDAAYATMPKSRRERVHGRIAMALENLGAAGMNLRPEELARHYSLAGEHLKTCRYWKKAAEQARSASASIEARAYIDAALDANARTPEGAERDEREIELRQMLVVPLEATSWGSSAIAANLERLGELLEHHGRNDEQLMVLHGLATDHGIFGRVAAARRYADELLERYADNEVARALGLRLRAFCHFLSGEFDAAIANFERTAVLATRVSSQAIGAYYHADMVLVSRSMICWAMAFQGRTDEMGDAAAAVRKQIEKASNRWNRIYALNILASAYQVAGNAAACLELVSEAMPSAEESRSEYWLAWSGALRGWGHAMTGHPREGRREIEQAIERYLSTGSAQMLPYAKALLAEACLLDGDMGEVRRILDELAERREPAEIRYIDGLLENIARRLPAASAK